MAKNKDNAKSEQSNESDKPGKGRPSLYSEELGIRICEEVATTSASLQRICDNNLDFPHFKTVFRWLNDKEKADFCDMYARAKRMQAELMVDEITDIADDGATDYYLDDKGNLKCDHENIQRSRLKVDARKWIASKLLAKKYGDRLDLTSGGEKLTDQPKFDLSKLSDGALAELEAARIIGNKGGAL